METAKIMNTIELQKMVDKLCTEKDAAVHSAANFIKENIKQRQEILKLTARIAELEEFKMIVEGCGFEVITEPPVLNHPERKILKGHGTIYVPELPEPPEVTE